MCTELVDCLATKFPEDVRAVYAEIRAKWDDIVFTGSQAIGCAGPDSDWDFVVWHEWPYEPLTFPLEPTEGPRSITRRMLEQPSPRFTSLRFGRVNLIIEHHDPTVLDRWRVATDYCIDNCVYDKPARIAVFEHFGAG